MPERYVFATKGPLAGRRWIGVPVAQLPAATNPTTGWAIEMVPGANMIADYDAPFSYDWMIPGFNAPPAIVDPPVPPAPPPPPPPPPSPVAITSLSNESPAKATVALANITKFHNGDTVTVAGVPAPYTAANGAHAIANVTAGAGTFTLTGVDLTAAAGPITDSGMTALPQAAA